MRDPHRPVPPPFPHEVDPPPVIVPRIDTHAPPRQRPKGKPMPVLPIVLLGAGTAACLGLAVVAVMIGFGGSGGPFGTRPANPWEAYAQEMKASEERVRLVVGNATYEQEAFIPSGVLGIATNIEVHNKSSKTISALHVTVAQTLPDREVPHKSATDYHHVSGGIAPGETKVVRPMVSASELGSPWGSVVAWQPGHVIRVTVTGGTTTTGHFESHASTIASYVGNTELTSTDKIGNQDPDMDALLNQRYDFPDDMFSQPPSRGRPVMPASSEPYLDGTSNRKSR